MRDDDLPTYLGSSHSALGLLLFALGCLFLLAFGLLAFQIGMTDQVNDLGNTVWLIPFWSAVAIPLGLSLRRKEPSVPALLLSCSLLAMPIGMALISRF